MKPFTSLEIEKSSLYSMPLPPRSIEFPVKAFIGNLLLSCMDAYHAGNQSREGKRMEAMQRSVPQTNRSI